ncbi:hypothetical protein ARAM_004471 [Aspergillus rambellii]|uniref:Uncharacterized protein n=1 Tax=Aspergillus rambellii TaxID=308745 RepID=A0A0F8VBP1_9EURO|nr:hypothetical protein ARAM_004471 [Aspergillus rambellii]
MSARTIFLMGAPTLSSLQWDESELLDGPIPPFQDDLSENRSYPSISEINPVKWRLLQGPVVSETPRLKDRSKLERGAEFFLTDDLTTPTGMPKTALEDLELSQFYNHSFTVHETSEVSAPGALSGGDGVQESGLWSESTVSSMASNNEGEVTRPQLPIPGGLTDLQDIPKAAYLHSIVPQTMSVNLIVAIIAIRPARRIVTRQWKREVDLVEVVVGDETRSGFGVTFWVPPGDHKRAARTGDEGGAELRKSLTLLRPRDIVLFRTIALGSFRERVYGQSLRRGLTKIELLHRQPVDATDTGGIYKLRDILSPNHAAQSEDLPLEKVRRVHEWIRRFVDFVPDPVGGKENPVVTLPPDTQEDARYN